MFDKNVCNTITVFNTVHNTYIYISIEKQGMDSSSPVLNNKCTNDTIYCKLSEHLNRVITTYILCQPGQQKAFLKNTLDFE